jgi:hypothetical protein
VEKTSVHVVAVAVHCTCGIRKQECTVWLKEHNFKMFLLKFSPKWPKSMRNQNNLK